MFRERKLRTTAQRLPRRVLQISQVCPASPTRFIAPLPSIDVQSCSVKTDGGRLEVSYPGVQLGVFSGSLQYTVYKGSNLIRQEVIAKTEEPAVAYKYDAGVKGMTIAPGSRVVWRDTANLWQAYEFGGAVNQHRSDCAGFESDSGGGG